MIFKKDNLRLGLVLGLLAPVVSLDGVLFRKVLSDVFHAGFLLFSPDEQAAGHGYFRAVLGVEYRFFTVYINSHRDNTAKGIFAATMTLCHRRVTCSSLFRTQTSFGASRFNPYFCTPF